MSARCECGGELKLLGAADASGRLCYRCKKCKRKRWGRGRGELIDIVKEREREQREAFFDLFHESYGGKRS